MKWIGFVVVPALLAAFGVATFAFTRPPERGLDSAGQAWVNAYEAWSNERARALQRAVVGMTFEAPDRNARLVEPLRDCSTSLIALGEPPELLRAVQRIALEGCGRAEHARRLDERFSTASLGETNRHLGEAEDRLQVAARTLRMTLGGRRATAQR